MIDLKKIDELVLSDALVGCSVGNNGNSGFG